MKVYDNSTKRQSFNNLSEDHPLSYLQKLKCRQLLLQLWMHKNYFQNFPIKLYSTSWPKYLLHDSVMLCLLQPLYTPSDFGLKYTDRDYQATSFLLTI